MLALSARPPAHLARSAPVAGDRLLAAIAVLLVAGELLSGELISYDPPVAPSTAEIVVSLALVAPLAFGPRAPVAVFATVMATCLVQLLVTEHVLVADRRAAGRPLLPGRARAAPAEADRAGRRARRRRRDVGAGVVSRRARRLRLRDRLSSPRTCCSRRCSGDRRVSRRARLAALEVERDQQAEIGAARERARIARELHDVVAHSLAVMVAQADGGRYAASEDPGAADPCAGRRSRERPGALAQMRRLLGVLRVGEEGGDLQGLVRRLAGAGLTGRARGRGPARELPAEVGLQSTSRQEALTNVLKHADSPRRVEVVLRYLDAEVELDRRGRRAAARRPRRRRRSTALAGDARARRAAERHGARRAASRRRLRGLRAGPRARGRPPRGAGVTRVFMVDDQALVRGGLRLVIDSQPDMTVVGEAGDGREALERLAVTTADIVLMDVRMPRLDGVAATRLLIERDGAAAPRVIVLTTFDLDEYVFPALRAGASGFLLKNAEPEELLAAIRAVASGDAIVAPTATRRLLEHVASTLPTRRSTTRGSRR
jgi:DNA-binding NarL/FixJ family response regulator/signal transduction histidine kinase